MNKEKLYMDILDMVGTYCEGEEDFDRVLGSIEALREVMQEDMQ